MQYVLLSFLITFTTYNATSQWESTFGPNGGRIYDLKSNGSYAYAATNSGLYRSDDGGNTWNILTLPANSNLPIRSISLMNDKVLVFADNSFAKRHHLLLSEDMGSTWAEINTIPDIQFSFEANVAITIFGLYISDRKVVYYSTDGGSTWQTSSIVPPSNVYNLWEVQDGLLYICLGGSTYRFSQGIDSWEEIADFPSKYIDTFGDLIFAGDGINLHRSTDGGQNWETLEGIRSISNIVKVNDKLYRDGGSNNNIESFYESSDDGQTWQLIPSSSSFSYNQLISIGSDILGVRFPEGIFRSTDYCQSFINSNNGIYAANVAALGSNEERLIAVIDKVGAITYDIQNESWDPIVSTPSSWRFYDIETKGDKIFVVPKAGVIIRSLDGGTTWENITPDFIWLIPDSYAQIWINNNKLYIGGNENEGAFVRYSNDFGDTWELMTINIAGQQEYILQIAFMDGHIFSLTYDGIFHSTDDGLTWESVNDGWKLTAEYNLSSIFSVGNLIFISVEANPGYQAYTFVSYNYGDTWQYADAGCSFGYSDLITTTGNDTLLFTSYRRYIPSWLPSDLRRVDGGVFISVDSAKTWMPFNDGLNNGLINDLTIQNDFIYAATSRQGVRHRNISEINLETITGEVYLDYNSNGIKDINEPPLPGAIVSLDRSPQFTMSSQNGKYKFYSSFPFADTIKIITSFPSEAVNPPYHLLSSSDSTFNFGVIPKINHEDVKLELTHYGRTETDSYSSLTLTCENIGTVDYIGSASLLIDPDKVIFENAVPPPSFMNGDTLFWDIELESLESKSIKIEVFLSALNSNGTSTNCIASLSSTSNDSNPDNNYDSCTIKIVSDYIENHKTTDPVGDLLFDEYLDNKPLHYVVRFQNMTDSAVTNVRITDRLPVELDITSVELISSSHPCNINLIGYSTVEFKFEDISLPSYLNNARLSNGFLKFSVLPKRDLPLKSTISNFAIIEFDDHTTVRAAGISLDVAVSTFERKLSLPHYEIQVFPNPNRGDCSILLPDISPQPIMINIFDPQGIKISQQNVTTNQLNKISLEDLPNGIYYITGQSKKAVWNGKIILHN